MSNILIKNALWQCRIAQMDGSYKVDRKLIDLILQLFCIDNKWTNDDIEIITKIKSYSRYYNGRLMAYKINDVKRLLSEGATKKYICNQLD